MPVSWEDEAGRVREALARLGARGPTQRLPEAIRRRVLTVVGRGRQAGVSWHQLAAGVSLSASTLHRWQATASDRHREPVVVPVTIQAAPSAPRPPVSALVLVTASGHRLEGLQVAEAVTVLRALA
jgi:hypothetical protein